MAYKPPPFHQLSAAITSQEISTAARERAERAAEDEIEDRRDRGVDDAGELR